MVHVRTVRDARGALSVAGLPFAAARVFWIYDVPSEARRGGHAHKTTAEVVFCVAGAFTMTVDDGRVRRSVRLERRDEGLVIPAGVWCELTDFEAGTVVLVFASEPYEPKGYINTYSEYKRIRA